MRRIMVRFSVHPGDRRFHKRGFDMNMKTEWKWSSIASLADHLENKAKDHRASADRFRPKSLRRVAFIEKAAECESLAYMLRHSTFDSI
jgi:hypothetical protein